MTDSILNGMRIKIQKEPCSGLGGKCHRQRLFVRAVVDTHGAGADTLRYIFMFISIDSKGEAL